MGGGRQVGLLLVMIHGGFPFGYSARPLSLPFGLAVVDMVPRGPVRSDGGCCWGARA